ncbi:hypothetical protein F2Q69_00052910 [Brassica cretica]|uniref:Uncharacterized protein n=1 Tax=Brassica cretica TaxID=69181 RepID=A0A8S9MV36_BRACR|nr:hypothetical protein F2Q69_00052910 [Brassica cretica]
MLEISREMFSLKKKNKIQKNREAGKTKSSFVTIPKRIHEVSLRERLLKASDNRFRTAKHSSSNPQNGRVEPSKPSNSPNGRFGPSKPSNSPIWRVGPTKPSNSPNGRVGPNMLPSSHSHSILFCDPIELTLVSSQSESPSKIYSLEAAKNLLFRRKFGLLV